MKNRTGKMIDCIVCEKKFYVKPYQIKTRRFCSHQCYWGWKKGRYEFKYWLGKVRPDLKGDKSPMRKPEMREKISKLRKGMKFTTKHKENIGKAMKGKLVGENHWNWKGGKYIQTKSTVKLTYRRNYKGEYEHRKIAEQMLSRKLRKGEVVHHIDGNTLNNLPENLKIFPSNGTHLKFHRKQLPW